MVTTKTLQQDESQSTARDMLRIASLILIVIGLLVSGYLSYVKLTDTNMVCAEGGAFNCDAVQRSVYSKFMGIEVAYLGLATYVVLGALVLFEQRTPILQQYGPMIIFGITLFAFLFSMWLVYVQAVLLQAFCMWCLAHEVTMTLLFGVSGLRLRRALSE